MIVIGKVLIGAMKVAIQSTASQRRPTIFVNLYMFRRTSSQFVQVREVDSARRNRSNLNNPIEHIACVN